MDWLAHPAREGLGPEQIKEICRAFKLDGAEYCNSGIKQFDGTIPDVIGYGVDDTHSISMIGKNWIEMDIEEFNKDEVIKNLKKGNFVIRGEINLG